MIKTGQFHCYEPLSSQTFFGCHQQMVRVHLIQWQIIISVDWAHERVLSKPTWQREIYGTEQVALRRLV